MIPQHGAYALYRNNRLMVLIGYDLEAYEAVLLYVLPKVQIQEAEDFVEAVLTKKVLKEPEVTMGASDRWELYGLPANDNGPITLRAATQWLLEKLQEEEDGIRTHS